MTDLLVQIRRVNGLSDLGVAEPFAGGAGASLKMLLLEEASDIHINDADAAIFSFWWALKERSREFRTLLEQTPVSMQEWRRQREIYRSKDRMPRVRKGFSAFYLNRCNRSGIIMDGGPIGGTEQTGKWKLNARFNKVGLTERCLRIAEYRDRIHVSNQDGISFIEANATKRRFWFIDPPYFAKGPTLYLNSLDESYHQSLGARLRGVASPWILTYDDCPEIRRIYRGWANIKPFSLRYAAADRRRGKEILITPKWIKLPSSQSSLAIDW